MTLYPFRFQFAGRPPGATSPFLLQSGTKGSGIFDDFLNILLFVPFGFALGGLLQSSRRPRAQKLLFALMAGALFSYGMEFLQNYVPSRDSGWHDVFTNSAGALAGFLLWVCMGELVARRLALAELHMKNLLARRRMLWLIPLYYLLWLGASVPLQMQSRLTNWDSDCILTVGNRAGGRLSSAWKGEIYSIVFWDRALPEKVANEISAGKAGSATGNSPAPVAAYDFSAPPPVPDERRSLPDLVWNSGDQGIAAKGFVLDGKTWLDSASPVEGLVKNFQATNQFSLYVECASSEIDGDDKQIVSISRKSGIFDLDMRQDGPDLGFWFRNPLSTRRYLLAEVISNVFLSHRKHGILFTYDGANLVLFMDGQRNSHRYSLGPGPALARVIRHVKASELEGCGYVYYAMVFFPGGLLLGLAVRNARSKLLPLAGALACGLAIPPAALEFILIHVSGRAFVLGNVILASCIGLGGFLWISVSGES